jgi:hypothetical protein
MCISLGPEINFVRRSFELTRFLIIKAILNFFFFKFYKK